ncbi:hypothetical protein ABPG75_012272 [Micractinium tetrahymenae]
MNMQQTGPKGESSSRLAGSACTSVPLLCQPVLYFSSSAPAPRSLPFAMAFSRSAALVLACGSPALAGAASKAAATAQPGLLARLVPFSTSPAAASPHRVKGEELFGKPIEDVESAFREEHRPVSEPVPVNLEAEHSRVEDPEVPMLSSMFESHNVPSEVLSAEEAAAEVERLRKLATPVEGSL